MATTLERRPIHAVLYKPVLFMGLPRPVLIMEMSFTLAFALGLGLQWATFGLIVVIAVVVHPFLVFATRQDPEAIALFVRNFRHKDYYDAVPAYRAPRLPVHTSIPKA